MVMRLAFHKRILSWLTAGLLLASASISARIPDSIFSYRDTSFRPMWNRVNFDQFLPRQYGYWKILYPGTDTATLTATEVGGQPSPVDMGLPQHLTWGFNAEHSLIDSLNQMDFEIRFLFRQTAPTPGENTAFLVRGKCYPTGGCLNPTSFGPQMRLGMPGLSGSWDIYNSSSNLDTTPTGLYMGGTMNATPPAVNNTAVCRTEGHAGIWQRMGIRILNDTMSTLKFDAAGVETLCAKYKLTATNHVAATSPGIFSLQYLSRDVGPEFRDIRIKNLRAVPGSVSLNAVRPGQRPAMGTLRAERGALIFDIPAPGSFLVTVADPRGKTVARLQGNGPVAQARLPLKHPGLYLVRVVSTQGSVMRTVIVP